MTPLTILQVAKPIGVFSDHAGSLLDADRGQSSTPNHNELTAAVDRCLDASGSCLVIDCHSFPSRPLPYELDQDPDRPQICLGTDTFHTPAKLVEAARLGFESRGFTVALNRPFAGALVPLKHYGKSGSVSALMIEVNRGVYMDERSGERLPSFSRIAGKIQDSVREVLALMTGDTRV